MPDDKTQSAPSNFKSLLDNYNFKIPKVGDVVECEVIAVEKGAIKLDIQDITVGVVRGAELFSESKEYSNLQVGNKVEATVIDLENENGEMELSFRIAGFQKAWDQMRKYSEDDITIKSRVVSANKGGLMMQVEALSGFMPVSQLSPDNYPRVTGGDKTRILEKLQKLIGTELDVKVIDANQKEEKLIVSEKAVWEDSQKAVLDSYNIGDKVEGEVSALTSFGAFIKFGQGLEGLVHISEIAWKRIEHPRDVLKVGDKVEAKIIQLDKSKIYLSIKRLIDDPWKAVKDKYKVGDKVKGKILKVEPFGLMVALDEEIHGLAHISELSNQPIASLKEEFKVNDEKEFEIVSLEPMEHRLGLRLAGVTKVKKAVVKESIVKDGEPAVKPDAENEPAIKIDSQPEPKSAESAE
ncbi:MAG: 30S ribosomal protein S1 [Candidatus Magasanikbacteria bacterium CG10_big_fil_rev_8_21_14_0_10_40_10]|uniref:30S ribosomal protein S1 n=1 Tax=Candidatus Magasanikbacteria bacterium CG10_big_fil_rev_8_21_14_0_10_40_10 TaxID=1974648 RepID=A0A2M6W3N4_9BACT|nr:MAG: 30S ribosomal protein S1 [Candidatus Magasanikbacteria bacterium CG10_big_fil_rev_8_21_14_0_10_40_10]